MEGEGQSSTLAGTFHTLRFATPEPGSASSWPDEIVAGIDGFARGRARERGVCRLAWRPIHGLSADEWASFGNQPCDLGVVPSHETLAVIDADRSAGLDLVAASQRWSPSPWCGLYVDHELPPGADGFPEIFGSCHWYLWWFRDRWYVAALLEYPSSTVGRDQRWTQWMRTFHEHAARAMAREPAAEGPGLDVFGGTWAP